MVAIRRWLTFWGSAAACGASLGMVAEILIFGYPFKATQIFEILLLSPLCITFGGAHFSLFELRLFWGVIGFMFPAFVVATIFWSQRSSAISRFATFAIFFFYYFGLFQKTLGCLSVT